MNNSSSVFQCPLTDPITWHPSFTNRAANISSISAVVVQCLMIPFILLFNGITLLLVAKFSDLQKPRFVAFGLLSVTDFLSGVVAQPLLVAKELDHSLNKHVNCELDSGFFLSSFLLSHASFYQLAFLTYERYVGIIDPLHYPYRITVPKLLCAAVANWLIQISIYVIIQTSSTRSILFVTVPILVIVVLFCILYWYIKIFQILKTHQQVTLAQQQNVPQASALGQHMANRKSCITATYLVIGFGLSFFPIITSTLLVSYYGPDIRGPLYFAILPWVSLCVHLNSLFSPLYYGFRTAEFRKFVRKFFGFPPANDVAPLPLEMQPSCNTHLYEASQTGPS